MHILLLIAQLVAAGHPPLSAHDSAALHNRVEETEFRFMLDWRYSWQLEMDAVRRDRLARPRPAPPNYNPAEALRLPQGKGCNYEETARFDTDPHSWLAHLIRSPNRLKLSLCPMWSPPNWYEPADERKSIDASLNPEGFPPLAADTALLMRRPVLRLLDSAAALLPGDGWVAGQRVRLHLDQTEVGAARKAASDCKAKAWWCTALIGYVELNSGDVSRASATFDRARAMMPDSLRCDWDDASAFFGYTASEAYKGLTCAQRDSVNDRVWWLADPLYIENGNERRTEQFARHILIELHAALDVDERFDWRPDYQGPALREMILRYGWPTEIITQERSPTRWHTGNTRSLFLGDTTITFSLRSRTENAIWCAGQADSLRLGGGGVSCAAGHVIVPGIRYWGPQFHTVPLWQTVADPFHATDAGWDLAPPRDGGPYWDFSWWPTEFFRRDGGPLVPIRSQIAFFRRQAGPVLAAAMAWDTIAYLAKPLDRMMGAVIVSTGPYAPFAGVQDSMSGRSPHALVTTLKSGPALLSLEMVPHGSSGPAGRTRFGIDAPPPLGTLKTGELALSDVVITRANAADDAPTTFVAMLPRMLGSTLLRDPARIALFWELYGLATGDTVDVSLRIVRKDDPNPVQRLGEVLGVARKGDDSLVVRWTEPRPGDPTATLEGGVTIRPRGLALDVSQFSAGRYTLAITVQRARGAPVTSTREFQIERR